MYAPLSCVGIGLCWDLGCSLGFWVHRLGDLGESNAGQIAFDGLVLETLFSEGGSELAEGWF